jgi:hypothetical protein
MAHSEELRGKINMVCDKNDQFQKQLKINSLGCKTSTQIGQLFGVVLRFVSNSDCVASNLG